MRNTMGHALVIFLTSLVAVPGTTRSARADPITIAFTAFPEPGDPVNLLPAPGFVTFDSSLTPPGGGWAYLPEAVDPAATEISFFWGTTLWTTANADLVALYFNADGTVRDFGLGGRPLGLGSIGTGFGVDDIYLGASAQGRDFFIYVNAGTGLRMGRIVSPSLVAPIQEPAPIPEPATLLLCASGAVAIGRNAWKRRRKASFGADTPITPLQGH